MSATRWVVEDPKEKDVFWPSEEMKRRAWVSDPSIYEKAAKDPVKFWEEKAAEGLVWFRRWEKPYEWNPPYAKWFVGGKINACYNAVDRHVKSGKGSKRALIWVPEPPEESPRVLTYDDLYREVNRFANALKALGVRKGDRVGIYMPLIPETYIAILACARIGAPHGVVFSAFSSDSLRVRLEDAGAKVLITADGYYRRGKVVDLKANADEGIKGTSVEKVVVVRRAGNPVKMVAGRDYWWHELMAKAEPYCEPEVMDAEDMLFLLYTSGCCHEDSFIQLANGEVKKISEIVEKNNHCGVINTSLNPFRQMPDEITATHRYEYPGLLYEVRTSSAGGIFTPNHRFFSIDEEGNIVEKEARELKIGDHLFVVPKIKVKGEKQRLPPLRLGEITNSGEYKPSNVPRIPSFLTEEFAQLLGYLVGDGHLDGGSVIFTDQNLDTLEFYRKLIEKELCLTSTIQRRGGRQRLCVNSPLLAEYLRTNFPESTLRSGSRGVPSIIQRGEDACVKAFLRGLFDAEGSVGRAFVKLPKASKDLAHVVQLLLRRFGILSGVHASASRHRVIQGGEVKETGIFNLQISDRESLKTFAEEIGFSAPKKRAKLLRLLQDLSSQRIVEKKRFPISKLLRRVIETIHIPSQDIKKLGLHRYISGKEVSESKLKEITAYLREKIDEISKLGDSNPEDLEKLAFSLKISLAGLSGYGNISGSYLRKIRKNREKGLVFWNSLRPYILENKKKKIDELRRLCDKFEKMLSFEAILERVVKVGEVINSAFVYDLTTKRNHTYIVNGFITHNTTGRPKGVIHTTGGYLTQVYWTTKWVFDIHDDDVFWCTSDIGWITGHSYACYGPFLNCATMLVYEGAPDYPAPDRWWEIIEKFRVTILYTAPTAIRMFVKMGEEWPRKHDLSSLRLLGTVGEPIDREAWMWYFNVIGGGRCPITDTWWQTETGGTLIMSLPGIGPFIPSVAGRPFPGSKFEVVDEEGNPVKVGDGGYLVGIPPIPPSMLRGLYKADEKYRETYWAKYQYRYYVTNDGARKLPNGCIRVTGRVDDVMKVAGHRLSTAELEDTLNRHPAVVESAVVPMPHEIKGEVPVAYVILEPGYQPSDELVKDLIKHVDRSMGPIARPERIVFADELPKTRSGKIMRRVLKALLINEPLGDISTLQNPESVELLKQKVGYKG